MRLVSENLLECTGRNARKLHELWDKYDDGDLSTSSLSTSMSTSGCCRVSPLKLKLKLLMAASQIAGLRPFIVPNAENN